MSLKSVRARLVLWNFWVLALVLIVLGCILRTTVDYSVSTGVDKTLAVFADKIAQTCQQSGLLGPLVEAPNSSAHTRHLFILDNFHAYGIRIVDNYDRPMLLSTDNGTPGTANNTLPIDNAGISTALGGHESWTTVDDHGTPVRLYSLPLQYENRIVGAIQVGKSMTEALDEMKNVDQRLLELLPIALLVVGISGAFLTTRALHPVRDISMAANHIEAESLSGRLPVIGHDEFAELATTINGMLSRLEDAFQKLERAYEQQRRFAADASHELRTPLTVIKANTSLALSQQEISGEIHAAMMAIDRSADRTSRIVQDLLLLARSDAGQLSVCLQPTDIDTVLNQALDMSQTLNSAPIVLEEKGELGNGTIKALGDRESLVRLFTNLFTNAIRHTPETGKVAVSVQREGSSIRVTVKDSGEGIDPQHLPHVTERFYRADKARSRKMGGTGLGLAICKSIVESHHGDLDIESTVGVGTTVYVTLPAA
jgi:two-component system OmpR family sensor kinase